jgi:CBS domain-containing protein
MTESTRAPEHKPVDVSHNAATTSVRHAGPTADRYHSAMVRYLDAVAGKPGRGSTTHAYGVPVTLVRDVMTHGVVAAHEAAPFKEIVAALARNRVSAVPVIDDDRKVVGVVSETDLMTHMALGSRPAPHRHGKGSPASRKAHATTAGELMTTPAVTVRAHATIVEAARVAGRAGVRHLPVVDADGVLIGIISRGDLLRVFLRADDDIRDEITQYATNMGLDRTAVAVEVTEGVVTLTGKAERALQVVKLVNHVRDVSGVVEVDNRLTARFDDRYFPAPQGAR